MSNQQPRLATGWQRGRRDPWVFPRCARFARAIRMDSAAAGFLDLGLDHGLTQLHHDEYRAQLDQQVLVPCPWNATPQSTMARAGPGGGAGQGVGAPRHPARSRAQMRSTLQVSCVVSDACVWGLEIGDYVQTECATEISQRQKARVPAQSALSDPARD
jgi:hypothetical protein